MSRIAARILLCLLLLPARPVLACAVLITDEQRLYSAATTRSDIDSVVTGRLVRNVSGMGMVQLDFIVERLVRGRDVGTRISVGYSAAGCGVGPVSLAARVDRVLYLKRYDTGWYAVAQADLTKAAYVDPQIAKLYPLHAPPPPRPAVFSGPRPSDKPPTLLTRLPVITSDDYPPTAERDGVEGVVSTRLVVGADGRLVSCMIVRSSGSTLLDDTTCRLLTRRLRYKAVVQDGRPVTSYAAFEQRWRIPR